MVIIIGLVLGAFAGAVFFESQGWALGGILGALVGALLDQIRKMDVLEAKLKKLMDDQLKLQQHFTRLQQSTSYVADIASARNNNQPESHLVTPEPTPSIAKPTLEAVPQPGAGLITTEPEELLDLDLPEDTPPIAASSVNPFTPSSAIPAQQSLGDKFADYLRRFFTEGNPIVRVGMVVMFFGVSFLVKYASSQGLLPIELRLSAVLAGAIALLTVGWKTKSRPGAYGLVLQGGGIAIIYLTLFAAAKIYNLLPLSIAFAFLSIVVALGVLLALLQNAQVLAILATAGGFLAPILTSSGTGSHVGLFSFYLILNLGILAIALRKAWRMLNWVGFIFTFVISVAWGVLKYEPALYASTQPFLAAFFLLYLGVSILFSFKQPTNLKGLVDGSLIFGLPLIAFGLQVALLKHTEHGLAISAVVLAVIYLVITALLASRHLVSHRLLIEAFLALGICFATIAVPLALNAHWTSVTWALEAAGLVWVGLRQARLRARVTGYLLHLAAAMSLVVVKGLETGPVPIITGDCIGLVLLSLSSFTIAYLIFRFDSSLRNPEKLIGICAQLVGFFWWFFAGIHEIVAHGEKDFYFAEIILFAAVTGWAVLFLAPALNWRQLRRNLFAWLPFAIVLSLIVFCGHQPAVHPMQLFAAAGLLIFVVMQYRFLFLEEANAGPSIQVWHLLSAWWLFALVFWEAFWLNDNLNLQPTGTILLWFAAFIIPATFLVGAGERKFWPFTRFAQVYKNAVPAPLFVLLLFWFFIACFKTVDDHYLPLINELDLSQFAVLLLFAYAFKRNFFGGVSMKIKLGLLGLLLFIWLNLVTLRAVSHYQQLEYDASVLWNAVEIQMALSILWTLCAIVVMNWSRRLARRELWILGAGLLALVVIKLFTKDLTGTGTLARIVSFMVVGGLMLLIGYLSPIPARANEDSQKVVPHE